MTRWTGHILALAIALLWSIAGVSKLVSITFPKNLETLQATWSAQFSTPLLVLLSLLEISIGILLIAGYKIQGLALGIFLLAAFSITVILFPPTESQTCGCLGNLASLDASTLLSRIALLVGIHTLAWALLPNKSKTHP